MRVAGYDFLPQLWNVLEFVCNNYNGPSLPKKSLFLEEDEILVEKIDEIKKESKNEFF